jgi:hypothetical protein
MSWSDDLDEIRKQPADVSQAIADLLSGSELADVDFVALDMKGRERTYAYLLIAQRNIINGLEAQRLIKAPSSAGQTLDLFGGIQ